MPRGRPRLTPEDYQARLEAYCKRYAVSATEAGYPPYPSGSRETVQHREWQKLYRVHAALARRSRAQCARCPNPVSEGSIFCEAHRPVRGAVKAPSPATAIDPASVCAVCGRAVRAPSSKSRRPATAMHTRCSELVSAARALGPEAVARVRGMLWPADVSEPPRGGKAGR